MPIGMVDDGFEALLEMKNASSYNIIQDEESSVVWDMYAAAVLGADKKILPLNKIVANVISKLKNQ
jgi:two-component system chemotaxis response regulator CheB